MQKQYFYIALVVGICLEYAGTDDTTTQETQDVKINSSSQGSENEEEENVTDHTFVALIDIVYTDGSKRSCTGAIIDDNVVVTAAHCFVVKYDPEVQPELTASFVVIGTKKMFDSGYEQYLPIERVLTHPKYHEWAADISLVYTFAAMTADKPGTVIALAGDKTSHVENNVTVFSWGRYGDSDSSSTKSSLPKQQAKYEESCEDTSGFIGDEASNEYQTTSLIPKHDSDNRDNGDARSYDRLETTVQESAEVRMRHNVKRFKITKTTHSGIKQMNVKKPKKIVSRYLDDELNPNAPGNYDEEVPEFRTRPERKEPLPVPIARESLDTYLESIWNKFISTQITQETTTEAVMETSNTGLKSRYKNWRRRMPTQTQIIEETTTQSEIETSDTNLKSHYKNWRRQMPTQLQC